jgi:hypothetical protein
VHLQNITVSRLLDNAVEVSEGVSPNDRIVNNPSAALLEGDKVRVVAPAPGYDLEQTEPSSRGRQSAKDFSERKQAAMSTSDSK